MLAKPTPSYTCIIARGNAAHHSNHRMHAIIRGAWHPALNLDTCLFYGGIQTEYGIIAGSHPSAARQARAYLKTVMLHNPSGKTKPYVKEADCGTLMEDEIFNSTSYCCQDIVRNHLWHGHLVRMVSDWVSMPRIWWLLRHHCRQSGLPWATARQQLRFVVTYGTFVPYARQSLFKAPVNWVRQSLMHELRGWRRNLQQARHSHRTTPRT